MQFRFALLMVFVPALAFAQTPEVEAALKTKLAALKFVLDQRDTESGGYRPDPKGKPGLRATSAAVRAIKYLGGKLPESEKTAAFVMKCYDPETGGFAEPGGKPSVLTTAVGVMGAVDLGIPKEKYAKAMDYLKANAKTFEDVRITAAAVEAWGLKDLPFDKSLLVERIQDLPGQRLNLKDVPTRQLAGAWATVIRLGYFLPAAEVEGNRLDDRQRPDGGWADGKADTSDAETTYRVMRAIVLTKWKLKKPAAVRKFLTSCRNVDGGFGVIPGGPSSVGGTYFYAIITKWLDDMEK